MQINSSSEIYSALFVIVIVYYLERDNEVLIFYLTNSSFFEVSAFLF